MSAARSQTVRRRQLGRELRRLREAAGKSAQEASDWAGVSTSTLSKIERGSQAVKIGHVRLFAQLYGVGVPEVDTLVRLGREGQPASRYQRGLRWLYILRPHGIAVRDAHHRYELRSKGRNDRA